jgi:capsular polysaccharide transport system permease protein
MTSSSITKTSGRSEPTTEAFVRPEEERIGRRFVERRRRKLHLMRWILWGVVVAPTALAALYFSVLAAPRYVSETQFVVRTVEGTQLQSGTSLQGLLQAIGITRSDDNSSVVLGYLRSRDAVANLEAALPLRKFYGRNEADFLARFPRPFFGNSFERLYWYYGDRVTVKTDDETGISTIMSEAFQPQEAQAITRQLLLQAEQLVNKMNARLEANTIRTAEAAVAEAQKAVTAAQEDIDRFRSAETVVDPTQNAVAQLSTITDLSTQVDQVLAQILAADKLSPSNPTIAALKAKADALTVQIENEQKALAGSRGAVSTKVSGYERLTLLRGLADASLSSARQWLDSARTDARRQHVFVEEVSSPNLPDYSTEPQRLRSVATVFAISAAAATILWLVSVGVKERGN